MFVRNRAQNYIKILIRKWFFGKKFITLQAKWRIENGELRMENGEWRIENGELNSDLSIGFSWEKLSP